jgi:hypothetical protein
MTTVAKSDYGTRTRDLDEVIGRAHQIGAGRGTTDGEEFELDLARAAVPTSWQWVSRNVDKPHRCPGCHGVALRARSRAGYGPRTLLRCENGCRMRWRVGSRASRYSYRFRQVLDQAGISWSSTRKSNDRRHTSAPAEHTRTGSPA